MKRIRFLPVHVTSRENHLVCVLELAYVCVWDYHGAVLVVQLKVVVEVDHIVVYVDFHIRFFFRGAE